MTIQDFFLLFPDEPTYTDAFDTLYPKPAPPTEIEQPAIPAPYPEPETSEYPEPEQDPNLLIDVIGYISEPTGETTTDPETGDEYPVMRPVPGWHVNVRCIDRTLPDGWDQYVIPRPATPVREFAPWVEPLPLVTLEEAKEVKLSEFDAVFVKLDALKIRPSASIAEALSKGQTPDPGDVYVLSETQAVTEENRRLRDLAEAAESVEAVRAVSVWWPGEAYAE